MLIAFAAAVLAAAAPADTAPATLRGAVLAEPDGAVLANAVVEVEARGRTLLATTDSTGAYVLRRVPAGFRVVRVRSLDHEPQEVRVLLPPGAQVVLDVSLKPRPVMLDTLVAVRSGPGGGVGDTAQAEDGTVAIVSSRLITEAPGAAAAVPGAGGVGGGGEPGDPRDVLWVRGSAADLKLVLLDGAPVYTPFHMGGLVQTFEPEVLGSARLYLGGAPARYDGGLSYVMEMDTRSGRAGRPHASGAADLVSAKLLAEGGAAGRITYLASARAVNGRAVQALGGDPFPYEYSEGLARIDVPTGSRSGFSLTGFANGEGVRVDTVAVRHEFARWGNAAGSLRWRGPVTGGTGLEATAAYSRFYARLPWSTEVRDVLLGGDASRLRMAVDLSHGRGRVRTRYGASYDRAWNGNTVWSRGERTVAYTGQTVDGVAGTYVDLDWQPAGGVALRGGLRGDYFGQGTVMSISPRLAATWVMSDRAAITLAGGRYHQYVKVLRFLPQSAPSNVADSLNLVTGTSVARATHLSLSLDQQLPHTLRLGMEGYFKRYERLTGAEDESYTSGVDVWVRRTEGAVTGWMGYSLTWAWTVSEHSMWGSDRFAGRQVITSGVAGPLGRAGRFDVRFAYGAGLPFTAIPTSDMDPSSTPANGLASGGPAEAPPLAETPREPYLRVDAQVSRTWAPSVRGHRWELTPYLRVLNALDRRDALFYRYDQSSADHLRSLGTLPLLPIAGISFRT